jgi:thioredoxin reductase (NADPH)
MNDVIVYTQARCEYCNRLKDFLKKNQIDYTEKEVSNREHFDELMELKGQGVPFTLIHTKPYAGFNERVKTALMGYKSQNQ